MPTTSFHLRHTNATLTSTPEKGTNPNEFSGIGYKSEGQAGYPVNFRSRRAAFIFRVRGDFATINMPSGSGTLVSIDGGAYTAIGASAAAVLFTGLSDDWHVVRIATDFSTASFAADNTVSVTGAAPAMEYAPNHGRFWAWNYLPDRQPFAFEQEQGHVDSNNPLPNFGLSIASGTQPAFNNEILASGKVRFRATGGSVFVGIIGATAGQYRTKIGANVMTDFVPVTYTNPGGGGWVPQFIQVASGVVGEQDIEFLQTGLKMIGVMVVGGEIVQSAPEPRLRGLMINDSLGVASANPVTNVQEPLKSWEREAGFLVPLWIDGRSKTGSSLIQSDDSLFKNPDTDSATYRAGIIAANTADNPDFIFCARGANDFGRKINGVTMTRVQWRDGWTDFIWAFRDKASIRKIFMGHIPNPFQSANRATYYGVNETQTFQEAIDEIRDGSVAKGRAANPSLAAKCVIAPTTTWYATVQRETDNTHTVSGPTGNLRIAQNIAPQLSGELLVVATPTFAPPAGTYTEAQSVAIATPTVGATIYYTRNGSNPTGAESATEFLYSAPIAVPASQTIRAIAIKAGVPNSAIATAVYAINLPPLPAAPTALSHSLQAGVLSIAWTAPSGIVTGYLIERQVSGAWQTAAADHTGGTAFGDAGYTGPMPTAYRVSAKNGAGTGPAALANLGGTGIVGIARLGY